MKYAIYDKAADGYLTKLEFENDVPVQTLGLICGYNEYITEARLLDTKEDAVSVITRIESNKFMEKGRFVIHSFDDTLNDQYIISEAGNPTKVVDNITVDLDGNINVKYGTMASHWSTAFLEYAINRMNALQKAASAIYTPWNNTFDIYKVITIMDEKEHTHYQFIKVTEKRLTEYAKNEVDPLNNRIEELELANHNLGEMKVLVEDCANRLQEENDDLKTKVESIKKEARNWKKLYEKADEDREVLKSVIDLIYTDLKLAPKYGDKSYKLKAALDSFKCDDVLGRISMPTEVYYIQNNGTYLTAKDEICAIIDQILNIMESHDPNKKTVYAAEEIPKAIANDIINICEADDKFEITLKKFSQLYEAIWIPGTNDDTISHAFKSILFIFSKVENILTKVADENVEWKNKAQKAEKALDDQKKLNEVNARYYTETMERTISEKRAMDKDYEMLKNKHEACEVVLDSTYDLLTKTRNSLAEVIFAIRNAIYNNDSDAFRCIENRMKFDKDFNSDPLMAGVRENIKDICAAEKKKNDKAKEVQELRSEISDLLQKNEFYKRTANSLYGMTIPGRCCGKQMTADVITGKKILVDKKKYDDLLECVNDISLTYEMMKIIPFSMDRPTWLSGVINRIENLTK